MKKIIFGLVCLNSTIFANDFVKLETSVITDTSFENGLSKISSNVYVLEKKDIQNGGNVNVVDVLKKIPSIQIQNIGGSAVVDIRGEGLRAKDTVKILLNGIPLNYPVTAPLDVQGNSELDSIPIDIIERIEVLPSGGTILYGDNSSGGVINIITNKKMTKDSKGSIFTKYKKNDLNSGITLGHSFEKLDLLINYNEIDKHKNFYFGKENIKNFSTNINYTPNKDTKFNLNYAKHESKKDILQALTKAEYDSKNSSNDSPINYKTNKDSINFTFSQRLNNSLEFNLDTGYSDIVSKVDMDPSTLLPIPNLTGEMKGDFSDKKLNISPKLNFKYDKDLDFTIGYAYENVEANRNLTVDANGQILVLKPVIKMKQDFDLNKESHAGFIKAKYTKGDFVFIPGYRFEIIKTSMKHNGLIDAKQANGTALPSFFPIPIGELENNYSKTHEVSTGEMGIVYNYSDIGRIFYNITGGETPPSINKYINSDLLSGQVFKLNENLKNEKYLKNEIGITDLIWESTVSFSIFDTRKKDEIGMNGVAPISWEYYNIDETRRTGIELNTSQYFDKFVFSQNITYIDSEITKSKVSQEVGKSIPYVSDWNINASIKYNFNSNLSSTFSGNYKSKYRVGGEFNNGKLEGFPFKPTIVQSKEYYEGNSKSSLTFDWGITYTYQDFTLNTGVNNIFNEKSTDSIGLVQRGNLVTGTNTEMLYTPALGRSFYIGFSYNF